MAATRQQPPTSAEGGRLLRVEEAAYLLGVSAATIKRWGAAGHLEAVELPGAGLRIRAGSVERLGRQERLR